MRITQIALVFALLCILLTLAGLTLGRAGASSRSLLAFESGRDNDLEIYVMDIDRGLTQQMTFNDLQDSQPDWSPDGEHIAFVSNRDGSPEIYTMNFGCGGLFTLCHAAARRLTNNTFVDFDPAWSPDGERIAYTTEQFGYTEIMVINQRGGIPYRLTNNASMDANPAWSPDGEYIAFVSDRDQRWNADLYLMESDGKYPRRLTQSERNDFLPAWSPDGARLLFTSSNPANRLLAIFDLETGGVTELLDDRWGDDMPAWSPGGEHIALLSYREAQGELYLLPLNCDTSPNACLRRLTFNLALDGSPDWRPTSRSH